MKKIMSKKLILIFVAIILIATGCYFYIHTNNGLQGEKSITESKTMKVGNTEFNLSPNEKAKIEYTMTDNGVTVTSWKVDDSTIANVDEEGNITVLKNGSTTIHVKLSNGEKIKIPITVNIKKDEFTLNTNNLKVLVGTEGQINYIASPEQFRQTLKWRSSDTNIATVDNNGIVKGKNVGTTEIVIYSDLKIIGKCTIEVEKAPEAAIVLNKSSIIMNMNTTDSLTAKIDSKEINSKDINWSSSDNSIASVSKGKISAKKSGTATITATYNGKSANCVVTVVKKETTTSNSNKTPTSTSKPSSTTTPTPSNYPSTTPKPTPTPKPSVSPTPTSSPTSPTYSISWNINGSVTSMRYSEDTDTFSLPTPTRNGYKFIGWTGSNGTIPQKNVTIPKGTTGDKTYTANWEKLTGLFDGNGVQLCTWDECGIDVETDYDGSVFSSSTSGYGTLQRYPTAVKVVIPDGTTKIGKYAFYDCGRLEKIEIPNSVTSIGNGAFYKCSSLTNITIPNNVTSIGNGAFYECISLTRIRIPNNVTSIGGGAFRYCSMSSV